MADMRGLQDDSDMGPNQNYQPPHPAQYAQPGYSYTRGPDNFGVDQDLSMVQSFAHDIPPNMNQMENALQESNGHAQAHNMSISTANVPGMAPPQTPLQQSFSSPTNPRPSIDGGSQDLTNTGDGSKRKRSKVSRACDECRRKKIRCDATDDDGNVKTCTNCGRSGQTCDYSRVPMKRGPSKGYIKELSERVLQVESQMAMSGGSQAAGYRQSLDGSMPMYPEPSYSPDEPMSLKRNFSFSDARSNPFAQPQFTNRDRMPSTGGWSATSAPRPRDRGSIAVAPDQMPDTVMSNGQSAVNFSKPFWAQEDGPPTKRQKVTEDEDNATPVDGEVLSRQIELLQPVLPVFATLDSAASILNEATPTLQHATSFALATLTRSTQFADNSFDKYGDLEAFVFDKSRESPDLRTREENCTWMLLYLAMIINADQDLKRIRSGAGSMLSKGMLLKLAVDLRNHLKTAIRNGERGHTDFIRKAGNFTDLLARLDSLSSGSQDLTPLTSIDHSALSEIPPTIALLIRASGLFSMITTAINSTPATLHVSETSVRRLIEDNFDYLEIIPATERLAKELRLYIRILLARFCSEYHPVEILDPAVELASLLRAETGNLLTVHMFTLTAITLLEFTDTFDPEMATNAYKALTVLLEALSGVHAPAEEATGFPEKFWADGLRAMIESKIDQAKESSSHDGPNGIVAPAAHTINATGSTSTVATTTSTADTDAALAPDENGEAIPAVAGPVAALNGSGSGAAVPASTPAPVSILVAETVPVNSVSRTPFLGGGRLFDAQTGTLQLIDFRLLMRHGYLNVLAERSGF